MLGRSCAGMLLALSLSAPYGAAQQVWQFDARLVIDGPTTIPMPGVPYMPYYWGTSHVGVWLQARTMLVSGGGTNYGVMSAGNGPDVTSIIVTQNGSASAADVWRGRVGTSSDAADGHAFGLYGRAPGFRAGGPSDSSDSAWHTASANGPGVVPYPGSNPAGAIRPAFSSGYVEDYVYGFTAARPIIQVGETNPLTATPAGEWSPWVNLYRVEWNFQSPGWGGGMGIYAQAWITAVGSVGDLGNGQWVLVAGGSGLATAGASLMISPAPTAGAALVLGGVVVGMRRRR